MSEIEPNFSDLDEIARETPNSDGRIYNSALLIRRGHKLAKERGQRLKSNPVSAWTRTRPHTKKRPITLATYPAK